jgi:hypothetical protein
MKYGIASLCGFLLMFILFTAPLAAQERIQWIDQQTLHYDQALWPNCKGLDGREEPCIPQGSIRGETDVMIFHPLDKQRPAWISNVVDISGSGNVLQIEVASALHERVCPESDTDFILRARAKVVGETDWTTLLKSTVISWTDSWQPFNISLDGHGWAGKQLVIVLYFEAGGKNVWCDEHAALKTFRVVKL